MPRTKQTARKSAGSYQSRDATAASAGDDYGVVGYLPESMVFPQFYDRPGQLNPLDDVEPVAREAQNGRGHGSMDEVEEVSSSEFYRDKQTARKSALSFQTRERLGVPGEQQVALRDWARPPQRTNDRRPGRPIQTARKTAPSFQSIEEQDSESDDTTEDEENRTPEVWEQRRRERLRRMPLMPAHAARKSAQAYHVDSSSDSTTDTSDDDEGSSGSDESSSPTPSLSDVEGELLLLDELFPAGNDDDLAERSGDDLPEAHRTGSDDTLPNKRRRLDVSVDGSENDPQKEAQHATAQLQSHIKDLHDWLKTAGLIADAPVDIRRQIARHYTTPQDLASHINDTIQHTQDHILRLDTRVTTTHFLPATPEMSDTMRPILDDIYRLARMPEEGSLDLALRAMMRFATCYRGTKVTDGRHGLGKVSTDRPADFLLRSLLSSKKREGFEIPEWVKEQLDRTWTLLRGYDAKDGFFERTFDALERWEREAARRQDN